MLHLNQYCNELSYSFVTEFGRIEFVVFTDFTNSLVANIVPTSFNQLLPILSNSKFVSLHRQATPSPPILLRST